jgi:hypothetical protein
MHDFHDVRRRDRPGIRKEILYLRDAEEMITMAVCDIDRGQVLPASGNPVGENPVLVKWSAECRRGRHRESHK